MDVLSSQSTVTGYKAAILAAAALPKMFPMLTTAAGTVTPAEVLVVGAGVSGLTAIATARRLGAVVQAYDVRPAAQEDIESVGARAVILPLQPGDAEDRPATRRTSARRSSAASRSCSRNWSPGSTWSSPLRRSPAARRRS